MRSLAFVVVASLVGVGCGSPDETLGSASALSASATAQASPAPRALQRSDGALAGREAYAERAVVVWPSSSSLDEGALASLSADASAAASSAPAPVLVSSREALARATIVVLGDTWYSATANADGLNVTVGASLLAHRYRSIPPIAPSATLRGRPALITQNEGIWAATWREHGVSYSLDVECASPDEARCADDALLKEIAQGLVLVGGRGVK